MLLKLLPIFVQVLSQCTQINERKEWRQLSKDQQLQYLNAVVKLKQRSPGPTNNPIRWNFDQFSEVHYEYYDFNHSTKGQPRYSFFPWHRVFLYYYEKALQSIDPAISAVYWDWSLDSQSPQSSVVFEAFGLDGDKRTGCMTEGIAAGWRVTVPRSGCLARCNNFTKFWSPEGLKAAIDTSSTFALFHERIEDGSHAAVHNQIGGRCGDFTQMWSSNDPLFYLHHSMVDKLWDRWQRSCPSRAAAYSADPNSSFDPFRETFFTVANTESFPFCYSYSKNDGDLDLSPECDRTGQEDTEWLQKLIVSLLSNEHSSHLGIQMKELLSTKLKTDAIFQLDSPIPIPDNVLEQQKKDWFIARSNDILINNVTESYNQIPGYVSPAARRNTMADLLIL